MILAIEWILTSWLSIRNSLSYLGVGGVGGFSDGEVRRRGLERGGDAHLPRCQPILSKIDGSRADNVGGREAADGEEHVLQQVRLARGRGGGRDREAHVHPVARSSGERRRLCEQGGQGFSEQGGQGIKSGGGHQIS